MASASAYGTENNPTVQVTSQGQYRITAISISDEESSQISVPFSGFVISGSNNTFNIGPTKATVSPLFHYEILQFPLEEDEEFFGGLCGGLKDFERLRLLALLPLLLPPEAALLATE